MTDTLRAELRRWGFSDAEINVYFALLELGEGAASAVGDRADVSARHVYRVCERLEERGLVDVDEHVQPTRVRARRPSVVEDVIERSCTTMVDEIESRYSSPPESSADIEVLKRQPTVLDRARRLVDDADRWIILVAPPDVVESVEDELARAVDRGILVLLVTTVESVAADRALEDLATIVRTRDGPTGFQEVGLGVDKTKSLMVSSSVRLGDEHRYSPALYLDDETIGVRSNNTLFGVEWRVAREHLVPDPVTLPYSSAFFRETLLQAALHRRDGTALRATVEGRSVDDGRCATVDGPVVEVRQGIVEPYGQSFLGERTLVLETDEGRATVGGPPATLEDYAADTVTLYRGD